MNILSILSKILIIVSIISIIKNYKNNILILLSLELLFIGISLIYLDIGLKIDDMDGIITTLIILCISAIESALGLTILIIIKKNH